MIVAIVVEIDRAIGEYPGAIRGECCRGSGTQFCTIWRAIAQGNKCLGLTTHPHMLTIIRSSKVPQALQSSTPAPDYCTILSVCRGGGI